MIHNHLLAILLLFGLCIIFIFAKTGVLVDSMDNPILPRSTGLRRSKRLAVLSAERSLLSKQCLPADLKHSRIYVHNTRAAAKANPVFQHLSLSYVTTDKAVADRLRRSSASKGLAKVPDCSVSEEAETNSLVNRPDRISFIIEDEVKSLIKSSHFLPDLAYKILFRHLHTFS